MVSLRRNINRCNIKTRHRAKCGLERLLERYYQRKMLICLLISKRVCCTDKELSSKLNKIAKLLWVAILRIKFNWDNFIIPPILRTNLTANDYQVERCWADLRFRKEHLPPLMKAFGIRMNHMPFKLDNGSVVTEEEAFLFVLHRFSSLKDLSDCAILFGREYTQLSRMFTKMAMRMYDEFSYLLTDNIAFFAPRLEMYNDRVRASLASKSSQNRVVEEGEKVAIFVDATIREVARPNSEIQRSIFNGKDKVHAFKAQGVVSNVVAYCIFTSFLHICIQELLFRMD